jgi:hypothetical protein
MARPPFIMDLYKRKKQNLLAIQKLLFKRRLELIRIVAETNREDKNLIRF